MSWAIRSQEFLDHVPQRFKGLTSITISCGSLWVQQRSNSAGQDSSPDLHESDVLSGWNFGDISCNPLIPIPLEKDLNPIPSTVLQRLKKKAIWYKFDICWIDYRVFACSVLSVAHLMDWFFNPALFIALSNCPISLFNPMSMTLTSDHR